ncbi:RNA-binding region-containing protein 3 isoform X1 [Penaeus vannamei]|uniref:RNA-binding region-containing protein 3 n=2 Tax=Penaeus vannamei TaxID=6689 RepID=A0A3R7MMX9_PENVA|nr:RNA-binding region-containing protein 3-like [Penaeus vannamei]XP_027227668.1 RNA-binding region-containing protein 3-like [Penaeus vannamei]XP_027227669.1 RNA-binding region-containing protein 3-like [Penaeus vannamei]XP_027227670.1 RNA-binding region-containing protein 3-like [Penaeus vannamei]XP_027227671.1 RNA-binding region-containing protein 3-like [Penaeus vannamei]ROT65826.1 putative RNA-binding protein 40-like [Penaeus vannamei]
MSTTLRVWSFAKQITNEDKEDLLRYFGAVSVKHVSQHGQNKAVIARFTSEEDARYTLQKLHQQEVLGVRLMVAFHGASTMPCSRQPHETKENEGDNKETSRKAKVKKKVEEFEAKLLAIGSNFGVNHPIPPSLRYLYPPPSPSVIANIAQTLVAVPKFYTQVLHLMNKMNLPTPFGSVVKISHHYEEALKLMGFTGREEVLETCIHDEDMAQGMVKGSQAKTSATEAEDVETGITHSSSETESELESDENETPRNKNPSLAPVKRKLPPKKPINKKPKLSQLQQTLMPHPRASEPSDMKDVFEASTSQKPKKLALHLEGTVLPQAEEGLDQKPEVGGFGKIEVQEKEREKGDDPVEWEREAKKYITKEELDNNKISKADWPLLTVFKNYKAGDPTIKLYIKNLAKTVTEEDLKHIYGRYIFWQNDEEAETFTIRLMKEGRMKGQAFVTFPSVEQASEALEDTNGFILKDKPMVVVFGKVKS